MRSGSRWRRLGWMLVVLGLVVIAGWAAVTGVQMLSRARSLQGHLHYLENLADGGAGDLGQIDVEQAGGHLAGMADDLAFIQARVGPLLPVGRLLGWIPEHGGDLAASGDLLDMAVSLSSAGEGAFEALSPALDLVALAGEEGDSLLSAGEALLPVLAQAGPDLEMAQQELAEVRRARAEIDPQVLSERVGRLLDRLDRYLPWFETAVDAALAAPDLLGADAPRTYLVVAQNNQELRATGGFISGVGELRVEGGRLQSLTFRDSYAVDNFNEPHEVAPLEFRQTLFGDLILFRDANWDPDFPASAQKMIDIYGQDQGVRADGVIALDLTALQLLVAAAGPLQVEGVQGPVTGQNVLAVIEQQWAAGTGDSGSDWWLRRKDFMGDIASVLLERLSTREDVEPVDLGWAVKKALDEKHILVYVEDLAGSDLLRGRNWDGALSRSGAGHDFVLVVDSNVGFNKVDPKVSRSIDYEIDLTDPEAPRARLSVRYQNLSSRPVGTCVQESRYGDTYADMMDRCYWDYVRAYVPAGSELLSGPDLSLPVGSLLARNDAASLPRTIHPTLAVDGWSVWAAFFDLPPMEEVRLVWDYQLPLEVLRRGADGSYHYRLRVQKQAGTVQVPLRLRVSLPPGADLVAGSAIVETDLRLDREFLVTYRIGEAGP
jgi:hypothetical protein